MRRIILDDGWRFGLLGPTETALSRLPNGTYRTAAGSLVTIDGIYGGRHVIDFDWFEEGACIEAHPSVDVIDGCLHWNCGCCPDGGSAARPAGPRGADVGAARAAEGPELTDADRRYLLWRQARDAHGRTWADRNI